MNLSAVLEFESAVLSFPKILRDQQLPFCNKMHISMFKARWILHASTEREAYHKKSKSCSASNYSALRGTNRGRICDRVGFSSFPGGFVTG